MDPLCPHSTRTASLAWAIPSSGAYIPPHPPELGEFHRSPCRRTGTPGLLRETTYQTKRYFATVGKVVVTAVTGESGIFLFSSADRPYSRALVDRHLTHLLPRLPLSLSSAAPPISPLPIRCLSTVRHTGHLCRPKLHSYLHPFHRFGGYHSRLQKLNQQPLPSSGQSNTRCQKRSISYRINGVCG